MQPPRAFHDLGALRRRARRAALVLVTLAVLTAPGARAATDWEASLDLRLVSSDAEPSFMEGGLGRLRYGRLTPDCGWGARGSRSHSRSASCGACTSTPRCSTTRTAAP